MATVFLETPDATQGTQWWSSVTGTVTYDNTLKKSGLASWKCDSGAGNAAASLSELTLDAARRLSLYIYLQHLPSSTINLIWIASQAYVAISSAGVLELRDAAVQIDTGSTLSTGTWYRICLALDGNNPVTAAKVFLDGVEDMSVVGQSITWTGDIAAGWITAPGANKALNIHHVYADDVTDLTDTGDMRVTAKRPDELNDNNYDTTGGTGAVNERPLSETNYMSHEAKSSVLQDWTLETAAEGDVDISGDTLVARCAWMWAKSSKADDTVYIVDDGDSATGWADQVTATLNTKITDSAVYPSNAAGIGQKSGAAAPDEFLYECGTLIAYTVSAAGPQTLTPTPATVTLVVVDPIIVIDQFLTPTPAVITMVGADPVLSLTLALTPTPVTVPLVVGDPSLALTLALTPTPATVPLVVVDPTIGLGTLTLTPTPATVPMVVADPTLALTLALTPTPATVPMVAVDPTLSLVLALTPTPATVPIVIPDPVVVAVGGPAGVKTINDLLIASVKTINDLVIASVKTINDAS